MIADLLVGACLLDASTRGNLKLVETNLRLFYSGWSEGESRLRAVQTRLDERDAFAHLFGATESIAVIGISDEPNKPAFYVPSYLKEQGYRLWGIHPRGNSDLAEQTTLELKDLNNAPDLVLIFRRSEKVSEHLDDLLSVLPRFVWMQQGIRNDEVAEALRAKGVTVVSDRCAMVEHQKLF